jgi:hypothetical protein
VSSFILTLKHFLLEKAQVRALGETVQPNKPSAMADLEKNAIQTNHGQ